MDWVALGLWVGIPLVFVSVFWVWGQGVGGIVGLFFGQVFSILGYTYTLTSAAALATSQADLYEYPYRTVDDYLFDLRFGVVALLVGLTFTVYPLLPLATKERVRKENEAQKIHEKFNAVYKHIEDRGYGWRDKRRMLTGKDPLDPLELTILIAVLVVIVIGLAFAFTYSVFG